MFTTRILTSRWVSRTCSTSLHQMLRDLAARAAVRLGLLALLSFCGATAPVSADCEPWSPTALATLPLGFSNDGGQPGIVVNVSDVLSWDHDGSPLSDDWLVVAGTFTSVSGVPARNIAAWDGLRWRSLGEGLDADVSFPVVVRSLAVLNGQLYAGGGFRFSGATEIKGLARFNGANWEIVSALTFQEGIDAIAAWNGNLAIATSLGSIRIWNGTTWSTIATLISQQIYDLHAYGGELYAAGSFLSMPGVSGALRIARWNGTSWSGLAGGLDGPVSPVPLVRALTVDPVSNTLVASGRFNSAGGQPVNNIAAWNGSTWNALGGGITLFGNAPIEDCVGTPRSDARIVAIRPGQSSNDTSIVWQYDGSAWIALTPEVDGKATAVGYYKRGAATIDDDRPIVAGEIESAAGKSLNGIGEHNGNATWLGLHHSVATRALATAGDWIYGGGDFTLDVDNGTASYVVRWNGTTVEALVGPSGEGTNGLVRAIYAEKVGNVTTVYVGGDFTVAGGVSASRVARFTINDGDRTGVWSSMSSGFNDSVLALAKHAGEVYAAGEFTSSGIAPRAHIARWNGSSWQSLGLGLNGDVHALASYGGKLHATGEFGGSGFTNTLNGIGRWSGSTWEKLDNSGLGSNPVGRSLFADGATLLVGGTFFSAGGAGGPSSIARWDGSAWSPVGTGLLGDVHAITMLNGQTWVGGTFTLASVPKVSITRLLGNSWEQNPEFALPQPTVRALAVFGGALQVGGDFSRIGWGVNGDSSSWAELVPDLTCCPADLDADGAVGGSDLAALLAGWGTSTPDLTGDAVVDGADLAAILAGWGGCQ